MSFELADSRNFQNSYKKFNTGYSSVQRIVQGSRFQVLGQLHHSFDHPFMYGLASNGDVTAYSGSGTGE